MRRYLVFAILIWNVLLVNAQVKTSVYTPSSEDFPNPERGFYLASGSKPGEFSLENLIKLRSIQSVNSPSANYATFVTLIYKGYLLSNFKKAPISKEFLQQLQNDFDLTRKAGLKMILRFSYTDKTHKGDCPDGAICPPYGDASKQIVLQHISQLRPLLQRNGDIIAVVQQGFIGIWGENHYTDYFGDASRNDLGFVPDSSWLDRSEMLKALLDAVPANRMVQVRTPQIKQRYLHGPNAGVSTSSITQPVAFSQKDAARIGLHNDCFLASADDYGTYSDYGNSVSEKVESNEILRKYFAEDSRYVAVGGETCDDAFSPQNDCGPLGYAEQEMAALHYSFLNVSYNNLVNNDWEDQGCMTDIKKNLGYRLVLEKAVLPQVIKSGDSVQVQLELRNDGFASPFNPRPVQLIFRNSATRQVYQITLNSNVQHWFSGKIIIDEKIKVSESLETGKYEMLLQLPDAASALKNRPEYSIRFANQDIWEPSTGFNQLNHIVTVRK